MTHIVTAHFTEEDNNLLLDAMHCVRELLEEEIDDGFVANDPKVKDLLTVQHMIITMNKKYLSFEKEQGLRVIARMIEIYTDMADDSLKNEDFVSVVDIAQILNVLQRIQRLTKQD